MFACVHAPSLPEERHGTLLDCAEFYSPLVEDTGPDAVILCIDGLNQLFGSDETIADAITRRASEAGLAANVAVAGNPDTSLLAARGFAGVTVIPPGEEAHRLGNLPASILNPSPEMSETFERWGIRRLKDLGDLPEDGLAERLGREGVLLRRRALGRLERPLVPMYDPADYAASLELEDPVALLEPLSFLLARLIHDVCAKLVQNALAAAELRLRLMLETREEYERTLRLPFPMRDSKTFLKLLQLDLEGHPPPAPIVAVSLFAQPVKPRTIQTGLFFPAAPEPQRLELTLVRIANLVGEENTGSPRLVDTHRPGAFEMVRFSCVEPPKPALPAEKSRQHKLAFRAFCPTLQASVRISNGHPSKVAAPGVRGEVLSSAGPWRTSGDWWTATPWSRDEWDVSLSDGALYRIYFDRLSNGWFVEGSYD